MCPIQCPNFDFCKLHLIRKGVLVLSVRTTCECFLTSSLFFFSVCEFRSLLSTRDIAGPGGVIGPLPRPKKGGRTTAKRNPIGPDWYIVILQDWSFLTMTVTSFCSQRRSNILLAFWLLFSVVRPPNFSVVRPPLIWPWKGSRSCNGLNGPKGPKFKNKQTKRSKICRNIQS